MEAFLFTAILFLFHMKMPQENFTIFAPWIYFLIWYLQIFTWVCFTSKMSTEQEGASGTKQMNKTGS